MVLCTLQLHHLLTRMCWQTPIHLAFSDTCVLNMAPNLDHSRSSSIYAGLVAAAVPLIYLRFSARWVLVSCSMWKISALITIPRWSLILTIEDQSLQLTNTGFALHVTVSWHPGPQNQDPWYRRRLEFESSHRGLSSRNWFRDFETFEITESQTSWGAFDPPRRYERMTSTTLGNIVLLLATSWLHKRNQSVLHDIYGE